MDGRKDGCLDLSFDCPDRVETLVLPDGQLPDAGLSVILPLSLSVTGSTTQSTLVVSVHSCVVRVRLTQIFLRSA